MATYTFDKIEYGSNVYVLQDSGALQLTGGQVTGPVTFGDSIYVDDLTAGQLVVEGSASIANNLQVNTINGVTVGSSPKFTDTVTTISTTGSGNAITAISASNGALTATKGTTFLTAHNTYTVSTSGTGNAVTAVSLSGTTFTVTKGATYSNNAGTITGVTAGSGLSGGGTSSTVTLNHSNSVTAQTTQAVYPIKIDAQGHISAYGSAVTITDKKLEVAEVTSATQYYPIVGTGTTAATRQYDTTGFKYKGTNGTTSAVGSSILELGNNTGSGTANNKQAQLIMYGSNTKKATITLAAPSADIALALPTSGGTIALTSQIPSVPTVANNATTGISIAAHSSTSIYGVKSTTTTASKASGGNGSASTWVFEDVACDDITAWSAGSASTWAFTGVTVANSISGAVDSSDSTQLNITLGTTTVQSKSSGANGSAPSLSYTAKTASHVKSGGNGTAPTWSFTNVTVPIRNDSTTTVVTSTGHTVTDNGHTHTLS